MITVKLLKKPVAGHKDIFFELEGITGIRHFDFYYFAVELRSRRDFETSFAEAIAILLDDWVVQLKKMSSEDTIYLPIDISDQYIGCIRAIKKLGELNLSYGCIMISGLEISSMAPDSFYTTTEEFLPSESNNIVVNFDDFCGAIKLQADNLRNQK